MKLWVRGIPKIYRWRCEDHEMELTRRQFTGRLGQVVALLSVGWSGATSRKRWGTTMDPVQYWPRVQIPWDQPDG